MEGLKQLECHTHKLCNLCRFLVFSDYSNGIRLYHFACQLWNEQTYAFVYPHPTTFKLILFPTGCRLQNDTVFMTSGFNKCRCQLNTAFNPSECGELHVHPTHCFSTNFLFSPLLPLATRPTTRVPKQTTRCHRHCGAKLPRRRWRALAARQRRQPPATSSCNHLEAAERVVVSSPPAGWSKDENC